MTTSAGPAQAPAQLDRRMAAFVSRTCPEAFHAIAAPNRIWEADPFDVEDIHVEARTLFERALHRAGGDPAPATGTILVLLGEAGCGKTHLMRAFRTRAHEQALGYCGYMQMTTEASNYPRYMLANLISGLDQRYDPHGPSRTGLARLSGGLLECVPEISAAEIDALRAGELTTEDPGRLINAYADRLQRLPRFHACDIELLRVMLHLERAEPRVRSRALMWLRCRAMNPGDRAWIGDAVPRTDEADPLETLKQLARLADAVHGTPLVILIDQLEDMANQSAPEDRFRRVVDAIAGLTDAVPNTVVVTACLEDYYKANIDHVTRSKRDRLEIDPAPLRLSGNRTLAEIRAMTARRLAFIFESAGAEIDPGDDLYPFRDDHMTKLANLRARDALDLLRKHHNHCIIAGHWEEANWGVLKPPPPHGTDLDQLWNECLTSFTGAVPDDEEELAKLLSGAVQSVSEELPHGFTINFNGPVGRYIEVETRKPRGAADASLIAICNANAKGGGFGKQLDELLSRAGSRRVAVVRTVDFPKTGKAVEKLAEILKNKGRRVLASDSDWRTMLAFEAFWKTNSHAKGFDAWQKAAKPLGELESLEAILNLSALEREARRGPQEDFGGAPPADEPAPVPAPDPPAPGPAPDPPAPPPFRPDPRPIVFGQTIGVVPEDVTFDMQEFVRHAAFLGATGSGKTTAALNIIEQLLARGIPAVLIDRKGDLCRYAADSTWEVELHDALRTEARKALRSQLDVVVYTPGEPAGRPLAPAIVPRGFDQLSEAERERYAGYAADALGGMIGFKGSDADKGQRVILAKAIEALAGRPGSVVNLAGLRTVIEGQDALLLNAIGGIYPAKYYAGLAERLLTMELNNKHILLSDDVIDLDKILGLRPAPAPAGRVRLSVISTRFLGDAAKVDFWVAQFLSALSRWCARSPKAELQAVFLFDEADAYLPAGARKPATKAPMEDLLKRARSAGVGIFLATQSPGDLDYKCRENVRTWVIGRVAEPRAIEKLKPMFTSARSNAGDKLAGQKPGEFQLVRESGVAGARSFESLLRTEQAPEAEILALVRRPGR